MTLWFSDEVREQWRYTGEKQRGAQFVYSDWAITILWTLKKLFHLPNRAAEGFVRSMFALMGVTLPVPDHTTLSRRGKGWKGRLPKKVSGHLDIVIDSTGLKVYGEGEWKVRMHGKTKRRTWRKLHLAVDPQSGEIEAVLLTENNVHDAEAIEPLLEQIEQPIDHLAGDGSYDRRHVYDRLRQHSPGAKPLIPPRKDAHIWQHGNRHAPPHPRDENLRAIRQMGRKAWKETSGYHQRSSAETAVFRYKTIFGDRLSARLLDTQRTEALICCAALNRMTHLGMPESYKVIPSVEATA